MRKICSIAWNDYLLTVASRTFIISILIAPLLYLGIAGLQIIADRNVDLDIKLLMLVDRSGALSQTLVDKAIQRNRSEKVIDSKGGEVKQVGPMFFVEPYEGDLIETREIERMLSQRVIDQEIFAFAIIGKDILNPNDGPDIGVSYYSDSPTARDLPDWLRETVNEKVKSIRFENAGIHQRTVNKLMQPIEIETLGLADISVDGPTAKPKKDNILETFLIPVGAVFLLFIIVNMSAPLMLNMVIEEKMNKITEVLVSSVSPFSLMLGKLMAASMVGLTLAVIYMGSTLGFLVFFGVIDKLSGIYVIWFVVFLVFALLIYGSMWGGIGAACSELKETQNFAGISIMMVMAPMALIMPVLSSPGSAFSIGISLVPLFTPMLMLLRLGIAPGPAPWEIGTALALCTVFALFCVWAGGKIFRIGLLAQGQKASLTQIVKWLFSS